ncbi:MAG: 30S ribosomal protein S4 [Candidatus Diapherotrites archaeon]|nr:30S ribosomal protein S4 [Candidatus Diapherotrites archaeon]
MGDPKKRRKTFEKPRKVWDLERLGKDRKLKATYGLKNMREIWKAETFLRQKRQNARKMLALSIEERAKREKELINSLARIGLLKTNATIDDILGLKIESLLERRLQTIVMRKNLSLTAKQARQFITHGKISVNGKKASTPGYIIPKDLESTVAYYKEPMKLLTPEQEKKGKKDLKKDFEESAATEEAIEKVIEEKAEGEK